MGRLLDAGHAVTVFDIGEAAVRPLVERGAAPAGSAAEVAAAAEIVLTSLPTPDIVHGVALGDAGIAHGPRVTIVIDLSTTGPEHGHEGRGRSRRAGHPSWSMPRSAAASRARARARSR